MGLVDRRFMPRALTMSYRLISDTGSGSGGWAVAAHRLQRTGERHLLPWRLQLALAVQSLLIFVALSISIPSLETEARYVRLFLDSGCEGANVTACVKSACKARSERTLRVRGRPTRCHRGQSRRTAACRTCS